jgi:hypothetical protein
VRNSSLPLILLCALPLAAQTSAKPASVQGTVTNSVTGLPVPRAHVTLQGANDGKPVRYGATSGADGGFSFSGVAPGQYVAEADHIGFVRNQGGSPRDRNMVKLGADDNKTGVEIRLTPTGSITGRVTDSDGEPVEGMFIQSQGPRGGGSGMTDENGVYRIGGLSSGKYTVRSASRGDLLGGPPEIRTDGTTEVHNAATYYPGVLTSKEAGKIDVRAGTETPGADIRLVRVPFVRVSGRVVDMPADAQPEIMIMRGQSGTGTRMKRDGTFVLWRLDPGKYTLSANWQAPNGEQVRTVGVPIEVAGSNIDNIELRVVPNFDISGRLEFEDDEAKQIPKPDGPDQGGDEHRINLNGGGAFGEGEATAAIDANGAFQLKKVAAGKYRVQVSWGTDYIKSVRLGSTTTDGAALDLMRGSGGADLSVLMGAANSSISGTVQDSKGPAAGVIVVLVPAAHDADEETDDDFTGFDDNAKYSGTKPDGSYSFDHVAPGDYQIVAVPENEMSLQGNRVIGFEDQMESVTVGPKDKVTKDLKRREPTPQ